MDLSELKKQVDEDLDRQIVSSKILLNSARLIDESSRGSSLYQNPRFIPFYYFLGKYIKPINMVEMGFRLGLFSRCFLKSCKTVKHLFAFQEKSHDFYSPRLALANVKDNYRGDLDFHYGNILDVEFERKIKTEKWEFVILNEQLNYDSHLTYLDSVWQYMENGGLIVMDYLSDHEPANRAFNDFCKIKNREPIRFETRYKAGLIER